jgi:hypothetical protein
LNDENSHVSYRAVEALEKIAPPELLPDVLERLVSTTNSYSHMDVLFYKISTIQERCGYYNYALAVS